MVQFWTLFFPTSLTINIAGSDLGNERMKILFGSCNSPFGLITGEETEQPLWELIVEEDANAFIWLGDTIYSDRPSVQINGKLVYLPIDLPHAVGYPPDSDKAGQLSWLYNHQKRHPSYSRLMNNRTKIFGT